MTETETGKEVTRAARVLREASPPTGNGRFDSCTGARLEPCLVRSPAAGCAATRSRDNRETGKSGGARVMTKSSFSAPQANTMNTSMNNGLPPQKSSREEQVQETQELATVPELDLTVDLLSDKPIVLRAIDCIQGMRSLPDGSVDVVVTSPPYNIGVPYRTYVDNLPQPDYYKWMWTWIGELRRILASSGSFFLNVGASSRNPDLPHEIALGLKRVGLVLQNTVHWIKSISVEEPDGTRVTVGHYKPVNSARVITNCHEYIFHISHEGEVPLDKLAIGIPFKDKSNISRFAANGGKDLRCRGNTWFIPYQTNYTRGALHPAQFPVELAEVLHQAARPQLGLGRARPLRRVRRFGPCSQALPSPEVHRAGC